MPVLYRSDSWHAAEGGGRGRDDEYPSDLACGKPRFHWFEEAQGPPSVGGFTSTQWVLFTYFLWVIYNLLSRPF